MLAPHIKRRLFTIGFASWAVVSVVAGALGAEDLFARLGSFGVALCVLFFLSDADQNIVPEIILERLDFVEDAAMSNQQAIAKARGVELRYSQEDVASILDDVRDIARCHNDDVVRAKSQNSLVEKTVLFASTLQWGFGDWIITLIHCGALSCSS